MAKKEFLTAPAPSTKLPKGIPYIIGNEAAERFSFYGMRCILVIFMTRYLLGQDGSLDVMNGEEAKTSFHIFVSAVYFFPIIGALISDIWLGKYRTILYLSVIYCLGHAVLAIDQSRIGLFSGLTLIVIGSGGIKPCVSALVGDQFGPTNKHLMENIFAWFYFAINLGCFLSTLMIPFVLDIWGPHWAFGIPGLLMGLATVIFWLGRHRFVHVPSGGAKFVKECFSGEGLQAIGKLVIIFLFVAVFFALFDQSGSAWVLQTEKMDRHWLGIEWLPSQIQTASPFMVMVMVPVFAYGLYPLAKKFTKVTPLRKIAVGFFVAAGTFALSAYIESMIDGGDIAKYTSRSAVTGTEATRILDGKTDGTGWSSAEAPTEENPQELVIRLRQRTAWDISNITLKPATSLGMNEVVAALNDAAFDLHKQHAKLKSSTTPINEIKKKLNLTQKDISVEDVLGLLLKNAEILENAAKKAKKAGNKAKKNAAKDKYIAASQAARAVAVTAFEQVNIKTTCLNDQSYFPKKVTLYAADFTGKLLPSLRSEMANNKSVYDPKTTGWQHIAEVSLKQDGSSKIIEFDTIKATHVLVQINSNYGADRVKIGEVCVNAASEMTEIAGETAGAAWPNVAAIGFKPTILWQFLAYFLITAAEVLVSVTCLEFAYTQSPNKMKSFIMALFLMSISLGNAVTAGVNHFIQNPDGSVKLAGADYYSFFAIMMLVTALLFIFVARGYKEQSYIQHESA
ncbi:MAG: MFS transporter [Phycisphaerae bacterium]|nr:MFS transporter [Phycisphaerae bacterium]